MFLVKKQGRPCKKTRIFQLNPQNPWKKGQKHSKKKEITVTKKQANPKKPGLEGQGSLVAPRIQTLDFT